MNHNSLNGHIPQPDLAPIDVSGESAEQLDDTKSRKQEEIEEASRVFSQLVAAGLAPIDIDKGGYKSVSLSNCKHELVDPLTEEGDIKPGDIRERSLKAVIRPGGPGSELFGVVRVLVEKERTSDGHHVGYDEKTILTEFGSRSVDGEIIPAKVIGALDLNIPVGVGRNHQDGLSQYISGNHLTIQRVNKTYLPPNAPQLRQFSTNAVVVIDNNSTNGTDIFVADEKHTAQIDEDIWAPTIEDIKQALSEDNTEEAE